MKRKTVWKYSITAKGEWLTFDEYLAVEFGLGDGLVDPFT